jgi:hypothetical protein
LNAEDPVRAFVSPTLRASGSRPEDAVVRVSVSGVPISRPNQVAANMAAITGLMEAARQRRNHATPACQLLLQFPTPRRRGAIMPYGLTALISWAFMAHGAMRFNFVARRYAKEAISSTR